MDLKTPQFDSLCYPEHCRETSNAVKCHHTSTVHGRGWIAWMSMSHKDTVELTLKWKGKNKELIFFHFVNQTDRVWGLRAFVRYTSTFENIRMCSVCVWWFISNSSFWKNQWMAKFVVYLEHRCQWKLQSCRTPFIMSFLSSSFDPSHHPFHSTDQTHNITTNSPQV